MRCRSFKASTGALIVRCPPFRLGIWNVLYFVASGCLYKIYETAFGLKPSSFATSLSDFAAFRVTSLDMRQSEGDSPALLCDSHAHIVIHAIAHDASQHTPSHLFQMPRNMAQNLPVSLRNSTTTLDSVWHAAP